MTQFGMQMQGGRGPRRAGPDVYTALIFIGTMALLVAAIVLWIAGAKVADEDGGGSPFAIREAPASRG